MDGISALHKVYMNVTYGKYYTYLVTYKGADKSVAPPD